MVLPQQLSRRARNASFEGSVQFYASNETVVVILLAIYLLAQVCYIGIIITTRAFWEIVMTGKKKAPKKVDKEKILKVERVQVGVRLEKRMVKVLKAVAEYFDVTLTDLLESIVLHSFEGGGANAFTDDVIPKIKEFQKIYGMDYGVHDNFRFSE
jgi:hypothetical protein